MAIRGQRPKPIEQRIASGNAGHRPLPVDAPRPGGKPRPLAPLAGVARTIWRREIEPAFWLSAADSTLATMFVHLAAELATDPLAMQAARMSNLRAAASSLGLDPSSRARLGTSTVPPVVDELDRLFFSG